MQAKRYRKKFPLKKQLETQHMHQHTDKKNGAMLTTHSHKGNTVYQRRAEHTHCYKASKRCHYRAYHSLSYTAIHVQRTLVGARHATSVRQGNYNFDRNQLSTMCLFWLHPELSRNQLHPMHMRGLTRQNSK